MGDLKIYKCFLAEHWLYRLPSRKSVILRLFLVSIIFKYFTNNFSRILAITLWNFAAFQKSLHSPNVKRHLIFSAKNIYVLPNHLRLRILGNQEILGEGQDQLEIEFSAQSFFQEENFCNSGQKLHRISPQSFLIHSIQLSNSTWFR